MCFIACLSSTLVLGTIVLTGASGPELPPLERSQLYTKYTQDCRTLDLATWSHPTRQVLESHGVVIDKMQLCNGDRYPIFTVQFKYDPQGQTTSYFHPLYAEMARANGRWPFSFVDSIDHVIIDVAPGQGGDIKIGYEDFSPPDPAAPAKGAKP